ncbi:E3 ubiquitin-protein ligase [Lachnellula occidentalis]|uniref:RBR-type E3 ubiquitin transferase n=1 Tax=Lachnellula occidentalis TaxID=215460 RepID=A0A8H8S4Q3_9HELO|nr:E3 ubiquitin-protein ligase [Lachnellula occidentalis]
MASNDGRKLTVFGLGFREHHGLRMQQLLREFQKLPTNPSDRTALFTGLFELARVLTDEQIRDIQPWLQNGGEFPKHVLPTPDVSLSMGVHSLDQDEEEEEDDDENEDDDEDEEAWPEYNSDAFVHGEVLGEDEEHGVVDNDEGDERMNDEVPEGGAQDWNAIYVAGNRPRRHSVGPHGEAAGMPRELWTGPIPHAFQVAGQRAGVIDFGTHEAPLLGTPLFPILPSNLEQQASGSSAFSQNRDPDSTDIECGICAEFFPPSAFPTSSKITEKCEHPHEMMACLNCIRQGIQYTLDEGMLHLLHCPFCHEILSYEEMKKYASPEAFTRYEYLVMKESPDTVMCLGRNCNKGQSHTDANPLMVCNSCGFQTCTAHKLPWHAGQTCDEFDMDESQLERLEREEATAKLLAKEQSKICPGCHQGVTKEEGCDHMMCRCGHSWCFECMASWDNIMRIGETAHAATCSYHPDRRQMSRSQVDARQMQMTELVHGGRISDALVQARYARNERVKAEVRPLAALAAERRRREAEERRKEVVVQKKASEAKRKAEAREAGTLSSWNESPKMRPRLLPPWEER